MSFNKKYSLILPKHVTFTRIRMTLILICFVNNHLLKIYTKFETNANNHLKLKDDIDFSANH